jgi:hypothetical protein
MTSQTRHLLRGFATLFVLAAALGCGGKIPEAIHQPLLVMPPEARAVVIVDFFHSRSIPNFTEIERFLHNRDADRQFRDMLPFSYQEFVRHWHLDPLRNIDQLVFAIYDRGWVAVMVGQFDPPHLIDLARSEGHLQGTEQRAPAEGEETYPVIREQLDSPPIPLQLVLGALTHLPAAFVPPTWTPVVGALEQRMADTPQLSQSWPSEHIWVQASDRTLLNAALDLWDKPAKNNLLNDSPFAALYNSRPHAALLWIGMPSSAGVPQPLSTFQAEVDIRDYITPKVILGYDTSEATETNGAPVDQWAQALAGQLQAMPEAVAERPGALDPVTADLNRLGLVDILGRAGAELTSQVLTTAKVIEISAPLPLDDFKRVFAVLANLAVTPNP